MPRKRKPAGPSTQGGHQAQPVREMTGRPYGDAKASETSQRSMPLPEVPGPTPGAPPGSPPGGAPASPQAPQDRLEAAMAAAARMRPTDPLIGPTRRPMEPMTAGMGTGPGSGPEMLRTGDRVARTFRQLAEVTGDPKFAELAEMAALRGR